MPVTADILERRATRFVLWSPRTQTRAPELLIGTLTVGNPPTVDGVRRIPLAPAAGVPSGLWEVPALDCGLEVGTIHHYWLEVDDSRSIPYVKTLVKLRTAEAALAVNDTDFIWTDFGDGKRVLVWRRGGAHHPRPVIVVANFSDFASAPGTDYRIPTWPGPAPAGTKWVEVTQGRDVHGRDVHPDFVGREAIFSWEAKVYTLRDAA